MHAEAVLLVHHRQPQAGEGHLFLEQGMGAHRHVGAALGHGSQHGVLLLLRQAGDEPRHLEAQGLQPGGELGVMLLGEDLRGRHHGGLVAILHRLEGGQGGHHRLAAAHVPLEQALHGVGLGEVAAHFPHHPGLGASELERQRRQQGAGE